MTSARHRCRGTARRHAVPHARPHRREGLADRHGRRAPQPQAARRGRRDQADPRRARSRHQLPRQLLGLRPRQQREVDGHGARAGRLSQEGLPDDEARRPHARRPRRRSSTSRSRGCKTDHIDLVQFHEILRFDDPDRIFTEDGAIEALLAAKKAGKVRFIGFTGHKDPRVHLYMLEVAKRKGFAFDTVQMPLNVMDAHFRSFSHLVVPRGREAEHRHPRDEDDGRWRAPEERRADHRDRVPALRDEPADVGRDHRHRQRQDPRPGVRGGEDVQADERATRSRRCSRRPRRYADEGKYELFKTSSHFDSTAKHAGLAGRGLALGAEARPAGRLTSIRCHSGAGCLVFGGMKARINNIVGIVPKALDAALALHKVAVDAGVPAKTLYLVALRASQINGCSICVDMHSKEMQKADDSCGGSQRSQHGAIRRFSPTRSAPRSPSRKPARGSRIARTRFPTTCGTRRRATTTRRRSPGWSSQSPRSTCGTGSTC